MSALANQGGAHVKRVSRRILWMAALLAAVPAFLGLAGCAGGGMDDLVTYVEDVKSRKSKRIPPIPEIQVPEIYVYSSAVGRDPFQPFAAEEPDTQIVKPSDGGISPPENHIREELEYYPLDSLRMVGTLAMKETIWALVTAPDGAVHRVRTGNYVGKNYGKITLVAEDHVELSEIVPDGAGGWQERTAKMDLSE